MWDWITANWKPIAKVAGTFLLGLGSGAGLDQLPWADVISALGLM